jgi:hypothetical protein
MSYHSKVTRDGSRQYGVPLLRHQQEGQSSIGERAGRGESFYILDGENFAYFEVVATRRVSDCELET